MSETLHPVAESLSHRQTALFDSLMLRRVQNILLVASEYDAFTFEEDGRLTEALYSEFLELNLRYSPNITMVSDFQVALEKVETTPVDLVIGILRIGDEEGLRTFAAEVKKANPKLPLVMLAYNTRELVLLQTLEAIPEIDRVFVWLGDVRLFLAIVKHIEDRANADDDIEKYGIQCIIVVEDNIRFYSTYLPLLYTELVKQTQSLVSDAINKMDRMLRMRVRPKILLATSYEEAASLYLKYKEHVTGVILDGAFPRGSTVDSNAGIDFAAMVRAETPDRPILIQSTDPRNADRARALGAVFIDKRSDDLLLLVRQFVNQHLGFGAFVFRTPSGEEVLCANDLTSFEDALQNAPDASICYHARRNDFSTWLKARGELELAKEVLVLKNTCEQDPARVRERLTRLFARHRERAMAGVVADFTNRTFLSEGSSFVRIGRGSLGGKGRGLAFMHTLFERYGLTDRIPGLWIAVPRTAVLGTDVFDQFMSENNLLALALQEEDDDNIAEAFLGAELPKQISRQLEVFLSRVTEPLAIRSSSLLEDASFQPFAGIYRTYMIPNSSPDFRRRLEALTRAIRLVFASTYCANAKSYIAATPNRLEEEKMAVVIQTVAGRRRGDILYPDMAGVARSFNFYPLDGMAPDEGVASVVLGLGKTVVDGGRSVRFSPAHPKKLYQFSSTEETLASAQREFLALSLNDETPMDWTADAPHIVTRRLDTAKRDGVLQYVGSVYSPENDAIYDGTSRPGVPLVTLAGVLKAGAFPLAEALSLVLAAGKRGFASPVEIEFAATIRERPDAPHLFSCLQVRPVVIGSTAKDVSITSVARDRTICTTDHALGNGSIAGVTDIVFVRPSTFDRRRTVEVAQQIGDITGALRAADRSMLLIGPGRWGTQDRWLGIPVSWRQIAGVKCIVETDMEDITVAPSQGTHFFQNITSFGIGYFSVSRREATGFLDVEWLSGWPAAVDHAFIRHIALDAPLDIAVNGRKHIGVIMKPGERIAPPHREIPHVL